MTLLTPKTKANTDVVESVVEDGGTLSSCTRNTIGVVVVLV